MSHLSHTSNRHSSPPFFYPYIPYTHYTHVRQGGPTVLPFLWILVLTAVRKACLQVVTKTPRETPLYMQLAYVVTCSALCYSCTCCGWHPYTIYSIYMPYTLYTLYTYHIHYIPCVIHTIYIPYTLIYTIYTIIIPYKHRYHVASEPNNQGLLPTHLAAKVQHTFDYIPYIPSQTHLIRCSVPNTTFYQISVSNHLFYVFYTSQIYLFLIFFFFLQIPPQWTGNGPR